MERDDTISRQAAIEAFDCSVGGVPVESVKYVSEYADKMMSRINALPSAHPETHEKRTETHGVCLDVIDADGIDEEIRCEMCENPMHTDRGCDGNCKYDEILYEKIIQILNKRITPLPSEQPEIIRCKECRYKERKGVDYYCDHITGEEIMVSPNDYCSWAERKTDE